MRKRRLEIILEGLEGFSSPSPELEQYATPASVAAEMVYLAGQRGDLGRVLDLGCGTGILAIGAALLGARAVGVDADLQALKIARSNAKKAGVHVDFIRADVRSLVLAGADVVVMNPPFGAQKSSIGDRSFLLKAMELAPVIYSLHNAGSAEFIRRFVFPCRVKEAYEIEFPLRRCFEFHSHEVKQIKAELFRIVCPDGPE